MVVSHDLQAVLTPVLDKRLVLAFRGMLRGVLVLPEDPEYDPVRRIFNAMIDRRPAVIVRCLDANDVIVALKLARRLELPVTVRGGGHSVAGHSVADGALLIDLSLMTGIDVDPDQRIARVQPGVRLGEFITVTEAYGLVSPTGTNSDTGVAGLTLGGGHGWLNGKFGLAVDNLLGAEVVTADGEVLRVNADAHPDLFWALRGGSGNFGVVTKFELALHPLPLVLGGMLIHPYAKAPEVLRFYQQAAAEAPDELTMFAAILTQPSGELAVAMAVCWCGSIAEGEAVLAPIRAFGPPVADLIQPMPYSVMNSLLDAAAPRGLRHYWKENLLPELSDAAIETVLDFAARKPSPQSAVVISHAHGAARRVATSETAFPHRDWAHGVIMLSMWEEATDDEPNIAWAKAASDAIRPYGTGGFYVNASWGEKPRAAFGVNYDRLAAIKQHYDPENLFHHNMNIAPAPPA